MAKSRRMGMEEKADEKMRKDDAGLTIEKGSIETGSAAPEGSFRAAILRGPQHVRRAPADAVVEIKGRARVPGMSAAGAAAFAKAGIDANMMASFRATALGANANQMSLRDLDIVHRESVRASYKGLPIEDRLADHLADSRIRPSQIEGVFTRCGGKFVAFPWTPKDVAVGRLPPKTVTRFRPDDWSDAFRGRGPRDPRPTNGWTDPPRGASIDLTTRVDVLTGDDLSGVVIDRARVEELLRHEPDARNVGEMLVLSQALTANGQDGLGLKLAMHASRVDLDKLSTEQRYQVQSLAPAAAFIASGQQMEMRLKTADAVLAYAKPGSEAAEAGARASVMIARQRADATFAAAARLSGPTRGVALEIAKGQYLEVLTSAGLEKGKAQAALSVQTATAVLDLVRATGVASASAQSAMQARAGADVTFDQRTIPMQGSAWLVGAGGLSSTIDPFVKAHAFHAWGRLHQLYAPQLGFPPVPLGGDLFRFDFLLAETRRLSDDIARIEALLTQVKQMLLDQALDKLGALTTATEELARLVDQLVKKVDALALAIPGVVDGLVKAARDKAVVIAIVEALKAWPHDRWIELLTTVSRDASNGIDPGTSVLRVVRGWLQPEIAAILADVKAQLTTTLTNLTNDIHAAALPQDLLDAFEDAATAAGATNPTDQILRPLTDALANIDLVAIARARLDELDTATVPVWAEALILTYVAAPIIAAVIVFAPVGAVGGAIGAVIGGAVGAVVGAVTGTTVTIGSLVSAGIAALLVLGVQYVISAVLRALGDALGLAAQLQSIVDRGIGQLQDLVAGLMAALADTGALQGMLAGITSLLGDVEKLLPKEVAAAVVEALTTARDTILDNAQRMAMAVQRAFFRETLEYVDVVPLSFSSSLPQGGQMVGYTDPRYGASAEVAAALSAFEVERVTRATDLPQYLTQVLSLRHILGTAQDLQPLMAGLPLNFAITQVDLDRIAPGLHRTLIKDVEVQIDFDVPPAAQSTLASVIGTADTIAGTRMDPALDGRVPGGGFPALPVVAGRVPTGIPALLTHLGDSRVRLKPSKRLSDAYLDACGGVCPPWAVPPTLRGTSLLDDPDPEAHAAGWRHLQLRDDAQELLFSHFDVLADGVRFVHAKKELKPFEHRGLVGSWRLEVPALVLGSVVHQLPPIRDVRLIVSMVANYDRGLADLLAQTPVSVVEPTPDATGLPGLGLGSIEDILAQLDATIASLQGTLEETVDTLGAGLSGLVDVSNAIDEALRDAADSLDAATLVRLSGVFASPTTTGTILQGFLLRTRDLANPASVLSGAVTAQWPVSGIDATKVVRVVGVTVTPIPSAPLIGGTTMTLPTAPATLGFLPAAAASGASPETEPVVLSLANSAFVTGTALTSGGTNLSNPNGTWSLRLPTGIPVAPASPAITEVFVGVLLETLP